MAHKWHFGFFVVAAISLFALSFSCEEGNGTGNGASAISGLNNGQNDDQGDGWKPQGPHYTLNIIGSKFVKQPDLNNPGRRIFPPLSGSTKIMLTEGDFRVLDGNGTDGPAGFRLPNPDPENDGVLAYPAWARTMAMPIGVSTTTTCATDATTGEEFCSAKSLELTRKNGKPITKEVSDELLYLYADVNKDGSVERYPLFDKALADYYWLYENEDLKHAQLRFNGIDGDDDDDNNDDDVVVDTDTAVIVQ